MVSPESIHASNITEPEWVVFMYVRECAHTRVCVTTTEEKEDINLKKKKKEEMRRWRVLREGENDSIIL